MFSEGTMFSEGVDVRKEPWQEVTWRRAMISERTIEEVKERASLLEIAEEFVKLKRLGTNYTGLCPFHAEKSPSFNIRDNGRFFHCFGCGVSGNAITFLMEARGLSFPDAVEELAARFGIKVEYEGKTQKTNATPDRDKCYRLNQLAYEFFKAELSAAAPVVKNYMKARGLTDAAIAEFGVGFAPTERAKLISYLKSKGAPEELLVLAGLARRSQRGELYDTFRSRIVFPIFVERKKIAGFGGRIIPDLLPPDAQTKPPKYLNSPESPVYEKNKILFGLPTALDATRRSRELYLVEGYMDVVGLWQAGVQNVGATCGTAVTENHVRRLAHLVQRVLLMFDGDSAGQNAAGKSYTVFLNSGIDCSAVFLPQDEDPDTISLKHGENTNAYLDSLPRIPLSDCYVDYLIRKSGFHEARELGAAAKGKIAIDVAETLKRVKNSVERAELIERAALKLMIEAEALRELCRDAKGPPPTFKDRNKQETPVQGLEAEKAAAANARTKVRKPASDLPTLDRDVLVSVMLKRDEFVQKVLHHSALCEALEPSTRSFILGLSEAYARPTESEQKRFVSQLLHDFGESWKALWIEAHEMKKGELNLDELFTGCLKAVERNRKNQQIRDVEQQLKEATDDRVKAELAKQLINMMRGNVGGAPV